jgi:hypothetical protein
MEGVSLLSSSLKIFSIVQSFSQLYISASSHVHQRVNTGGG